MNQVMFVGRITQDFEIEEKDNKKTGRNVLAVNRPYKNSDGIYETDFIPFSTYNSIAENCFEYCHKGDLLGIKGSLSSKDGKLYVNAEKVTFLSSKLEKDVDENKKEVKI